MIILWVCYGFLLIKEIKMSIKIGINGFGRIGRIVTRIMSEQPDRFEIRGINLRNADIDHMVYMCRYDSIFGRFHGTVEKGSDSTILINCRAVKVFSQSEPKNIDWASCGAEYIIESTGAFLTTNSLLGHLDSGAKRVLLTCPAKDDMPTFVMGVNSDKLTSSMRVISGASCTTNCVAPLAKVINDNFGINKALMSTIHSATAKQKTVDARSSKDWRAGRSAFDNIIPSSTGAAKACALVIPSLKDRITGMSFRVPTNDVSVVDLTAELVTKANYKEVCEAVKEASVTYMNGIIAYTSDPVVSADLKGESCTCIFDENAGIMLRDDFVKLIAWYDNEWGYSSKMTELIYLMAHLAGDADELKKAV